MIFPPSITLFSNFFSDGVFNAIKVVALENIGELIGSFEMVTAQFAVPPLVSGHFITRIG